MAWESGGGAVAATVSTSGDLQVSDTDPESRSAVARALRRTRASIPLALLAADLVVLVALAEASPGWLVLGATFGVLAASGGYYRSRLSLLFLDEAPGLLGRFLVAGFVAQVVSDLLGEPDLSWTRLAVAAAAVLAARAAVYAAVRRARIRRLVGHATLIVGAGKTGHRLATTLHRHPELGLRPVGFYDPEPLELTSLPVIADQMTLDDAVRATGARVVVLAFSRTPEIELVQMIRASVRLHAEVFYIPRLFELHSLHSREVDDAWGIPLVRLRRHALRAPSWRLKRVVDVVVSALLLALLAPVMLAIAAVVRARLGPPVLFRQRRISVGDDEFVILKFRTLPHGDAEAGDVEWTSSSRQPGPLGRFLRATSLDELPQLVNVLRGDMSLVGPRPERMHFARRFQAEDSAYGHRHRVRAGLTGLAQINGLRGDTSIEERAQFDNAYVERWSLANDIKILLRTPFAATRWRGR